MTDNKCVKRATCGRLAALGWCYPKYCEEYQPRLPLEDIVFNTVQTFRPGAPIIADDIRFAATVDGYDMTPYTNLEIGRELAKWCHTTLGPYGKKDRRSYIRNMEASA